MLGGYVDFTCLNLSLNLNFHALGIARLAYLPSRWITDTFVFVIGRRGFSCSNVMPAK